MESHVIVWHTDTSNEDHLLPQMSVIYSWWKHSKLLVHVNCTKKIPCDVYIYSYNVLLMNSLPLSLFLIPPHILWSNFNWFHYSIFIHVNKVLWSYSCLSFHPPFSCWLPPPNSSSFALMSFVCFRSRLSRWVRICGIWLFQSVLLSLTL
jgi:hypothetical protein